MGLTCSCDYEAEPGDVCWWAPNDYTTLKDARSKRCQSCGAKIKPGETVAAFDRFKIPESDVEIQIYGEEGEIPRATHYLCEECADLYFSLSELGFCLSIYDEMRALAREYAAVYGPKAAQHPAG